MKTYKITSKPEGQEQCPYSYIPFECSKPDITNCSTCPVYQEGRAKIKENAEIADNLKSYWANLNAGSAK